MVSFYFITYNSDWVGYEYRFNNTEHSSDIMFYFLSNLLNSRGYEFIVLYKIHIILAGFLYSYFVSKISAKGYRLIIFVILLNYVALGNMIRYYVAFPSFLCSLLFLYEKKYFKHILFAIFALLNHTAIIGAYIALYTSLLITSRIKRNPSGNIMLLNVAVFLSVEFATAILGSHFLAYLEDEMQSSIIGGLYNIFPGTVILVLLISLYNAVKKRDQQLYASRLFTIFFIACVSSYVYLLPSLSVQILANRYISPMLIFIISFMLLCLINTSSAYIKKKIKKSISIIVILTLFWEYGASLLILRSAVVYDELRIMLTSMLINN